MEEIVKLENVCYSYDKKNKAIDDVSFSILKGSHTVIVGHNGSGKSTIAKLICGLLSFNSGKIFLFNELVDNKNIDKLRNRIGIVFQNPDNQFVGTTVRDDIAFGLENRCVEPSKMDEIINKFAKKVGMEAYLDKEPSNLSGGQKQRVAIASVLALNSEILILDEATTMLDPKGKTEINELIKEIKKDNPSLTIISITHDINEVLNGDKIIVLNKGKVFYDGNLEGFINLNLTEIGLEKPFIYQIKDALENKGISIEFKDEEELIDKLWQLHLKK